MHNDQIQGSNTYGEGLIFTEVSHAVAFVQVSRSLAASVLHLCW